MRIYTVDADIDTGEWIGDPQPTDEFSTFPEWCKQKDTEFVHFDHYEHASGTRLVRVNWINSKH